MKVDDSLVLLSLAVMILATCAMQVAVRTSNRFVRKAGAMLGIWLLFAAGFVLATAVQS